MDIQFFSREEYNKIKESRLVRAFKEKVDKGGLVSHEEWARFSDRLPRCKLCDKKVGTVDQDGVCNPCDNNLYDKWDIHRREYTFEEFKNAALIAKELTREG